MKKSNKRNNKQVEISALLEKIACAYIMAVICGLPLIVHQRYIDILEVKANYFMGITVAVAVLILLIQVSGWWISRTGPSFRRLSVTDCFVILFAIVCTSSWLINDNKSGTFWGIAGRRAGLGALLSCVAMYFVISRYFRYRQAVMGGILLSGALVIVVAILNHLGWDPLHMFVEMAKDSKRISTIGNRNTFASFLSMYSAVVMTAFIINKERLSKVIYGICCVMVFMGAVASNSESILLVFVVIVWCLLYYVVSTKEEMGQVYLLLMAFGMTMKVMKLLRLLRQKHCWNLDGITAYLVEGKAAYIFLIAGFMGFFLCKREEKRVMRGMERVWKKGLLCITVAGIIGIMAYSGYNTFCFSNKEAKEALGSGYRYFYWGDAWGSGRIRIWKVAMHAFEKMQIGNKLIGYGPAGFYYAVQSVLPAAEYTFRDGVAMDAHNELLQMLVSTGVLGVSSYFGIFLFSLGNWINERKKNGLTRSAWIYIIVVLSYLAQGIFNNPNVVILPLVFVAIGIGEGEKRRIKTKRKNI